jgi:hypothetical protein
MINFSKQEKELLDIEKFFNNFKQIFPHVTYMSLETVVFSKNRYNIHDNLLPICIDIQYKEDKWALYTFLPQELNQKINNAIAYDVNENAVEYEKVKNIIFELLPNFFKKKAVYKRGGYSINTESINEILEPTKRKLALLEINNELQDKLPLNNKVKKRNKL